MYLLEHRDNRRVPLLQEEEHHERVSVRRQAAAGSVADVAHLAEGEETRKERDGNGWKESVRGGENMAAELRVGEEATLTLAKTFMT